MSDRLTKEQRHKNMSAIRGKNTKPELLVRKFLVQPWLPLPTESSSSTWAS